MFEAQVERINKTRVVTYTGVLTAFGLLIPSALPKLGIAPILTVTPLSHLPLMLAMFIHPVAAIFTYLGTTVAFFITAPYFVAIRAASHLTFVAFGLIMYKRGIGLKGKSAYYIALIMSLIHAASEALAALIAVWAGVSFANSSNMAIYVLILVSFFAYFAHSMFDWYFAYNIKNALHRVKML